MVVLRILKDAIVTKNSGIMAKQTLNEMINFAKLFGLSDICLASDSAIIEWIVECRLCIEVAQIIANDNMINWTIEVDNTTSLVSIR